MIVLSCQPSSGGSSATNILVSYALWGRRVDGRVYCTYQNNPDSGANRKTDCNTFAAQDLANVKQTCDGIELCNLGPPNSIIGGDPCVGTFKYTRVAYSCVDADGMIADPTTIKTGK